MNVYYKEDLLDSVHNKIWYSKNGYVHAGEVESLVVAQPKGWTPQQSQSGAEDQEDSWRAAGKTTVG